MNSAGNCRTLVCSPENVPQRRKDPNLFLYYIKDSDEEPNQGFLAQALLQFRQYIEEGIIKEDLNRTRIKFVDKVITPLEIDQLYEGHIEQSQQLIKEQILASEEYANDTKKVDFKRKHTPFYPFKPKINKNSERIYNSNNYSLRDTSNTSLSNRKVNYTWRNYKMDENTFF